MLHFTHLSEMWNQRCAKPPPCTPAPSRRRGCCALGNARRLLILCHLFTRGEASAGQLAEELGLGLSALSQHLGRMRAEGLLGRPPAVLPHQRIRVGATAPAARQHLQRGPAAHPRNRR